jgi:hypothetical protein
MVIDESVCAEEDTPPIPEVASDPLEISAPPETAEPSPPETKPERSPTPPPRSPIAEAPPTIFVVQPPLEAAPPFVRPLFQYSHTSLQVCTKFVDH